MKKKKKKLSIIQKNISFKIKNVAQKMRTYKAIQLQDGKWVNLTMLIIKHMLGTYMAIQLRDGRWVHLTMFLIKHMLRTYIAIQLRDG